MSQEDGPPRLKTSADAPPELQRALHALRTGDEGSPHLSRVAGRLGRLLDAPPGGPAPASTFLRTARRKLLATRFVVGSFAIGVTAAWLSRSPPSEQPTPAQTVVLPDHERDAPAAASAGVVTAAPPRVLAHPDAAEPVVVLPKPPVEPKLPPAVTSATRVRGRRPHALPRA
ncbi:MAG: hypothetical protein JWN04_3797, partial [Myxococcaceae bacterium]|nr:hypothetical protein [Myxococcaceae bacterium]